MSLTWDTLPPVITARDLLERTAGRSPEHQQRTSQPGVAGTGNLVIADVRWQLPSNPQREKYTQGHIPGAIFVDLEADLTGDTAPEEGRHPFPRDDDFAATLSGLGIAFEDTVVAYADENPMAAARFVVMLRYSGVNAALLDGGLPAYVEAAGADCLDSGEVTLPEADFLWQPFVRLVSLDEVAHSIGTRGATLVDARAAERYAGTGSAAHLDPRPGHIPGAINIPFTDYLTEDGTFRSPEEIRARMSAAGLSPSRITFHYCGSGVSASVAMLAMDLAGYDHTYLYPGSYSEWARSDARAVETGA